MTTANKPRENATPIVRSLVFKYLRNSDDKDNDSGRDGTDAELHSSLGGATSSQDVLCMVENGNNRGEYDLLPVDANLREIKAWLDKECKLEQDRVDWSSEYEHTALVRKEARLDGIQGPDTSILHRIHKRHGPRSSKFEDLLLPLHIDDFENVTRFGRRPYEETSQAMEEALLSWSKHIASAHDDPKARQLLMVALRGRVSFLDGTVSHHRSADAQEDSSRKLLHAIHAYRPGTAAFTTRDTFDILILILAHIGFAIPDIDEDMKYLIFYTLVTERGRMAHAANASTKRKLDDKIAELRRQGDMAETAKYEKKAKDWVHAVFRKNCDAIADRVKTARRNIQANVTDDLLSLVVLQAAQKLALDDKISSHLIAPTDPATKFFLMTERADACSVAATNLTRVTSTKFSALETSLASAAQNTAAMERTTRVCILERALKFAGLDVKNVSDAVRGQVVAERMANHVGTGFMMGNAVEVLEEVRDNARAMGEVMGSLDETLEEVEEAVEAACKEYKAMLRLVEGILTGVGEGALEEDGEGMKKEEGAC